VTICSGCGALSTATDPPAAHARSINYVTGWATQAIRPRVRPGLGPDRILRVAQPVLRMPEATLLTVSSSAQQLRLRLGFTGAEPHEQLDLDLVQRHQVGEAYPEGAAQLGLGLEQGVRGGEAAHLGDRTVVLGDDAVESGCSPCRDLGIPWTVSACPPTLLPAIGSVHTQLCLANGWSSATCDAPSRLEGCPFRVRPSEPPPPRSST